MNTDPFSNFGIRLSLLHNFSSNPLTCQLLSPHAGGKRAPPCRRLTLKVLDGGIGFDCDVRVSFTAELCKAQRVRFFVSIRFNNEEAMMFGISRALKCALAVFAAALMLVLATLPSQAASGSVRLHITKAGFIVGVGGGRGTLNFQGRSYPLSIGGVSVGTFGASSADLVGRASNLRRPEDIAGTYTAVAAGVAVAGGAKTARLRNSNGVLLEVRGRQVGLELSIDLSGMSISMR